ncbi:FKBP-type peptidyl-prolyl cis-trans isomerase [Sphingorhabdus arenilitoris]|uniref:Peptidyl-prolyl cis-trans isomerase n=1 Tax=Sphingorhabdus arenilitoris TaxID=1490041 RepID=A0ABV8RHP9_9SPHN
MSVTTVPIRPIAKGSLTKYWVGIALVLIAAGALAWFGTSDVRSKYQSNEAFLASNGKTSGVETTKSGLQFQTIRAGEGKSPTDTDVTLIAYKGTLRDGTVFDQNEQAPLPVNGVVPGFSEALKKMQKGGKYKVWIPSALGYGPDDRTNPQTGEVIMPGDSVLIFEIELKDFISQEEFQKGMAQMREQQEAAQKAGGGAGAGAGASQGIPPEIQAQLEAQMRGQQAQ